MRKLLRFRIVTVILYLLIYLVIKFRLLKTNYLGVINTSYKSERQCFNFSSFFFTIVFGIEGVEFKWSLKPGCYSILTNFNIVVVVNFDFWNICRFFVDIISSDANYIIIYDYSGGYPIDCKYGFVFSN